MLLSEGHQHARRYPIAFAWSEARIARQRHTARAKQDTALLQMAIASNFSKKGGKQLQTIIDRLDQSD